MNDLFRKEVSDHARHRLHGSVILSIPIATGLLSILFVLVLAACLAFATTASYARKETVAGWLTPGDGLIRVPARQGGVLSSLSVAEGQGVVPGQTIATLTLSSALEGGDSFSAMSRGFRTLDAAAKARVEAAVATLQAEQRQLTARKAAIGRERAEAQRRAILQGQRVELFRTSLARAEAVADRGFLPRSQVETRQAALLEAEQEASELRAEILSQEREINDIEARLINIPIDLRAARAEAESARATLDQQATQNEAQSVYRVVASVGGRVAALPLNRGQTAAPGATIAVLTAGDSALEAELFIPSRAAGFIRPGQTVRLMYQAFPHQKFGVGEGRIISVSRTVLAASEISVPGLEIREPVFRARVRLSRDSVSAYGETVGLQPGMLLSADVVIDKRTLLEWLLDPLYAAGRRA